MQHLKISEFSFVLILILFSFNFQSFIEQWKKIIYISQPQISGIQLNMLVFDEVSLMIEPRLCSSLSQYFFCCHKEIPILQMIKKFSLVYTQQFLHLQKTNYTHFCTWITKIRNNILKCYVFEQLDVQICMIAFFS